MRYSGQGWEIPVSLPHKAFEDTDSTTILSAFEEAYRVLFGRTIDGLACEITNWSLIVSTVLPDVAKADRHCTGTPAAALRERDFFDAALRRSVTAREVARESLTPGIAIDGPAIVVERETTTIVTSSFRVVGQGDGSLLLLRKETAK